MDEKIWLGIKLAALLPTYPHELRTMDHSLTTLEAYAYLQHIAIAQALYEHQTIRYSLADSMGSKN